jgi:uncharacterized protein (DUF1330 family)
MPAYVVANIDVHDKDGYEEYKKLAPASIAQYGGRYLARGGTCEVLEGEWTPKRLVILEFPTAARAREWWASPEYAPARAIRRKTAEGELVVIEGL